MGTLYEGKADTCRRDRVSRGRFLARRSIAIALLLPVFFLSACSFIPRDSFSAREQSAATIPGIPNARFWVDGSDAELREFLKGSALSSAIAVTGSFDVL